MSEPHVLTNVEDGVMLVTLNRPDKVNVMGPEMRALLPDVLADASARDDVKAVVITGAGDTFCAGGEISDDGKYVSSASLLPTRQELLDRRGWGTAIALAFSESDVPIIAAINGIAVGGGFSIALCCDVRFMADTATMGSIYIKRGVASGLGTTYWLPRIVGIGKAYELLYDGDPIDAERCLELGLANRVVPATELLNETLAYARKIASGPPLAYTATRRLLQQSTELSMLHFLEYEWTTQARLVASRDSKEGFRAFMERREPRFQGL